MNGHEAHRPVGNQDPSKRGLHLVMGGENMSMDETWRTALKSQANGQCVKVRVIRGQVQVGDSKDENGPVLTFTPEEWDAFKDGVRNDEFELA